MESSDSQTGKSEPPKRGTIKRSIVDRFIRGICSLKGKNSRLTGSSSYSSPSKTSDVPLSSSYSSPSKTSDVPLSSARAALSPNPATFEYPVQPSPIPFTFEHPVQPSPIPATFEHPVQPSPIPATFEHPVQPSPIPATFEYPVQPSPIPATFEYPVQPSPMSATFEYPVQPSPVGSFRHCHDLSSALHLQDLLSLMRIRDFLSLILTCPMRIGNEKYLKEWINEVSKFIALYSAKISQLSTADDDKKLSYKQMLRSDRFCRSVEVLLSKRPLRYVGGLIPQDIIRDVTNGGSCIFNESKSEELTAASSSATKEKQPKQVPPSILDLATSLAVEQLFQTLTTNKAMVLGYNFQYVMFSTRNDAEKQTVVEKIKASFQMHGILWKVLVCDVSKNQIDEKFEVLGLEVRQWLLQIMSKKFQTKDDNVLLARKSEKSAMVMSKHLVLLVDGDGDKKLDPWKVHFPKKRGSADVVVFITTESSIQQPNELIMEVDLVIKTEDHVLPWEVFCKNVGSELVHSSNVIQRIAVKIVKECSGHLLAIVLVAKSLQNVEDVQLWTLALEKLRYPNLSYKLSGFNDENVLVNAFINIIWVYVISERKNSGLMHYLRVFESQDWMLADNELFNYWFSEQLVHSQEEAEHTLRELVKCSILLQFEDSQGQYILLPEEINNILEELQEEETHENLKEGGLGLTEPPKVWHWLGAAQIELMHNNISKLPQSPYCPRLEVLYLHDNANLTEIPSLFFQHMPMLQVLDLSYTGIRGLPSSIFMLAQLKTLCLRGCKQFKKLSPEIVLLQNLEKLDLGGTPITHDPPLPLNFPKMRSLSLEGNLDLTEMPPSFFDHMPLLSILDLSCTSIHDLPSSFFNLEELREFYLKDCELFMELPSKIGRLTNLKKLDLDGTQITHLPKEIQELTNLESLSLSFSEHHHNSAHGKKCMENSNSPMVAHGIISKLTCLKYLRIDVNPNNEWWHKNIEHILAEVVGLERLRTLDLYVPEVKLLKLIPNHCISQFRFIVGHHMQRIISRAPLGVEVEFKQSNQSLRFVNGVDFPNEVKTILQFVHAFFLDRHMTINNLSQFELKNLRHLRVCILAECNEMQSIVDGEDSYLYGFLYLEFLTMFYMKNLRSIIGGPTPPRYSFSRLKFLALHTCPELTTIFTTHILNNLSKLEELIVEDCSKVSSLVGCQSSEVISGNFLPCLRKLSLLYLPNLISISNGLLIGRNLERIGFYYCPKLLSLSFKELSSKKLKVIKGEIKWWEALKWSEAEWGLEGRPHELHNIFCPIDEEVDVLTQLTT